MKKLILFCVTCFAIFTVAAQQIQPPFLPPVENGKLQDSRLKETSGLAPSHIRKDEYWAHNDSGDSARVFLIGKDGSAKGSVNFHDAVLDCEDIASGIGFSKGKYVYLGDIGDNFNFRPFIQLFIFKEDDLIAAIDKPEGIKNYIKVILHYDDKPKDAEALMIDPTDSMLYVISKKEKNVGVYGASLKSVFTEKEVTLKKMGTTAHTKITAADISADGKEIIIRNYDSIFYWKRPAKEPVYKTLTRDAVSLPYLHEHQGEAVCFTTDHSGFLTTSEGLYQPVYFYKRK